MSADLLRRAAKVLREHAESDDVQHRYPWCAEYAYCAVRHVERNVDLDLEPCPDHGNEHGNLGRYAGRYIALMHPPVGLALAEWLDFEADVHEAAGITVLQSRGRLYDVARAILREAS